MESLEKEYLITSNMVDKNDNLKMSSILDFSQEVASNHGDIMGIGFDDMIKRGLIWVIARNKMFLFKNPHNPKYITFKTKILKPKLFIFERDTDIIYQGELIGYIRTTWVILEAKTFNIYSKNIYTDDNFATPRENLASRKLKRFDKEELTFAKKIEVTYSLLDHNGHLNNTHYLDFYLDVYEHNFPKYELQIEYLKQAFLGDIIELYKKEVDGVEYLYGYRGDDLVFYLAISEIK